MSEKGKAYAVHKWETYVRDEALRVYFRMLAEIDFDAGRKFVIEEMEKWLKADPLCSLEVNNSAWRLFDYIKHQGSTEL